MGAGPPALSYASEKALPVRHAPCGIVVVATRRHVEEALDQVVFRDEVRESPARRHPHLAHRVSSACALSCG
jgi:hypothetical protein